MTLRRKLTLIVLLSVTILAGCRNGPEETLTVMAGSELEDLEPLFPDIARETGVTLETNYTGTLDGVDRLASGEQVDLAWFSHAKYLTLIEPERIKAQEKIMLSPVVLGVKESEAQAWGWVDNPDLTWRDIAAKADAGELRYAMTNPASSNSGFTALMGVVAALSGSPDAVEVSDVNRNALQGFFKGQALTSGSSGWLAESYVREQDQLGGMINYESVLMELNGSGQLREPLYLLYPREGIVTADYPLILLNEDKRDAYDKLVAYLRLPDVQTRIMNETLRRPAVPGVALSGAFPENILVELPFPGTRKAVENILFAYLDEVRKPSSAIFVLDVSGSMEGERLEQLQTALRNLSGLDESLTGQFARFSDRERLTFVTFSSGVDDVREFSITGEATRNAQIVDIQNYVGELYADGGTAMFSALEEAYTLAERAYQQDPNRYYSVVLMTDGENNEGATENDFLRFYASLPETVHDVKTFPILFGEADQSSLAAVAEATGGRLFDGRGENLSAVFKQIRGYQ